MLSRSCRLLPLMSSFRNALRPGNVTVRRNFWGPSEMRSIITDVNRQMERLERDFINFSPLRRLMPRAIPIQGTGAAFDAYRVNIDVQGYKPEEISISVKDGVLSVRAQMERSAEDGSKFYQEVKREFTLPDNIEQRSLKSFLSRDGVLCVEAPFKSEEKSKEIPVSQE